MRPTLAPAFVVTASALVVTAACTDAKGVGDAGSRLDLGGSGGQSGAAAGSPDAAGGQGGRAGRASGAAGWGYGGNGQIVNADDCPQNRPRMNDPCGVAERTCAYGWDNGCIPVSTCVEGRWRQSYFAVGACNPPTPCPETEPAQADTDACSAGFYHSPAVCRFPHGKCFTYLTCGDDREDARWHASAYASGGDSCCPALPPSVGEPCLEEGILCASADGEVVCRAGSWVLRLHQHGQGGATGQAGAGGST